MARSGPAALDYLGSEAEDFNKAQHLYLKPMAVIKITVVLPRMTIPGQSISNWDLMERLKRAIDPIQMDSCKVRESNIDSVIFEAELLSLGIMQKTMNILDGFSMKVSGFAEPLKVKTKEAKLDFPSRHDWDVWFMKNKIDETKPGERPDTVYLAKIPVKWFCDGYNDLPSERRLRVAMEQFGAVRAVDIPICDPLRAQMSSKVSGIQQKGFGLGQDVFFEAYVQYMEYKGFATAMDSLRNRKWAKRIDGRFFQALIKVDFDRSRHLSEAQIAKRADERRQMETDRLRQEEEELNVKRQEELKIKEEENEKNRRREDRSGSEGRRELERMAEEEKKRLEKERLEMEHRAAANRRLEGVRLLKFLFEKIEAREERRKRKDEEKLADELSKIKELVKQPVEQEDALRQALLQQREIRMRERLKEKMKAESVKKEKKKRKEEKRKERKRKSNRHDTSSSSSSSGDSDSESSSTSLKSTDSESSERRRRYRRKRRSSGERRHRSSHHQKTRRRGS
ncbi:Protein CBR-CUX-7 [Caenorhabditis briggsae]|uniref:Protein CBR-CUX-7 n=1 Tax=Caenorhabditis briggsae TaxID=6238 RepID=A8X883_CAEBR|nr:Protein CBR-CUX-7 [Caenorhabditis briggsae]CAP28844.2 Protein CBR-CUX-7 [Caenorhabditis briggsae]